MNRNLPQSLSDIVVHRSCLGAVDWKHFEERKNDVRKRLKRQKEAWKSLGSILLAQANENLLFLEQ